ncbi:MAG: hypothetical protein K1X72_26275 [Pyrinomonadaceae bacterium]|nr:hypothetical protein [Pyrinomonadaceae bacterium]
MKDKMNRLVFTAIVLIFTALTVKAQEIELEKFLDKADLATTQYVKTFKNLVAEELRTYDYFRKDGTLEDLRKIKSNFIVYQSPKNNLVAEYRNVIEFNGKNVAREDNDIVKFFEKLAKADSSQEEVDRLRKDGNRFDGKSHSYGMTLTQVFVVNRFFRPFFEFRIVGREKIEGREVVIVGYKQIKPTLRIKANATPEEKKKEPNGISFDVPDLPDNFRPTNPTLNGKLWLDVETAQLWRNEFSVSIQPTSFSKPVVSSTFLYEYQSSEFGVLLPKKLGLTSYRLTGKSENDLVKTKAAIKTFEYSKFSKPDSEIKETKTD